MIYLSTAIGLTAGGISTVHIYTQTIHRTTQSTQTVHRTTQLTTWEESGQCPVFTSYTLAFALQMRKTHGKPSVRVAKKCQLARWKQNIQNRAYITIRQSIHNLAHVKYSPLPFPIQASTRYMPRTWYTPFMYLRLSAEVFGRDRSLAGACTMDSVMRDSLTGTKWLWPQAQQLKIEVNQRCFVCDLNSAAQPKIRKRRKYNSFHTT